MLEFLLQTGILGGVVGILAGAVAQMVIYRLIDGEWMLLEMWRHYRFMRKFK